MREKIILSIFFIFLASSPAMPQYLVQGVVLDAQTSEPVPFASIGILDQRKGTSTNTNGEFILRTDSLPVKIVIAHISYQRQEISILNEVPVRIRLKSTEIMMEELVISGKPHPDYAYNLLENAFDRAVANASKSNFGKAFYRQLSANDDDYSELYEIFYDTRFSCEGITGWAVQEGRYAMNTGRGSADYVYNKNFTQIIRVITLFQPPTDLFIMPVSRDVRLNYDLVISGSRNIDGRKVMIVQFKPKKEITIPALEGEILIDSENHDIYLMTGKIKHDNFDVIGLSNPAGKWKEYEIKITVSYKNEDGAMLLDYIKLDQQFDYYVSDKFMHKVATHAFLTYYEYYTPERNKNLGGRLVRFTRSDRDILDKVGYNREFWDENPIVKRTPLEENVIASFEATNAFGSIYLNDREQVQLENNEIDNDPFIRRITALVRDTHLASRSEKIYLHLDKPFYASGETIWFSAYLVNTATHLPQNFSTPLYVDLIGPDGSVADYKIIKIDRDLHEGTMDISPESKTGIYRLRAYTNWMKNEGSDYFFDKPFSVYNVNEGQTGNNLHTDPIAGFDVRFFPEGGHSIIGIPGLIAFRAVDARGIGIDIRGKLIDVQGRQVAELATKHDGMGSFFIMPDSGETYTAVFKYMGEEKRFELPAASNEGVSVTVNNLKNNVIQVIIRSTSSYNEKEIYLVGQTRGIIYHKEKIKILKGGAIVSIPKSKLPAGVFHITVFDSDGVPGCERLVFITPANEMLTNLEAGNENPGYRESENITLKIKDQFGKPVPDARVSVSVLDASKIQMPEYSENIETGFLLQSDINGVINNPGYYFRDNERETQVMLDMLMLTKGWNRFRWKKIMDGYEAKIQYPWESGIKISGTIFKSHSREPVRNGYVNFIFLDSDHPGYMQAASDQSGRFSFTGVDIPDTLKALIQILDTDGNPADGEVVIDKIEPFKVDVMELQKYPAAVNEDILNYVSNENQFALLSSDPDKRKRIMMKEVVIKTQRFDREFYGRPDDVYAPGNEALSYTDIFQMIQGRFAGVSITGYGMSAKVRIRGATSLIADTSPLFLIDGVPISSARPSATQGDRGGSASTTATSGPGRPGSNPGANQTQNAQASGDAQMQEMYFNDVNSMLISINPGDVERIEVLKNPATTSAFGMRGSNGVIAIYTKRGNTPEELTLSKGYSTLYIQGYSLVRDFDNQPDNGQFAFPGQPDIRSLLYWNPALKSDRKGEIKFSYKNSDTAKIHQVVVEGITELGDLIHLKKTIGQAAP